MNQFKNTEDDNFKKIRHKAEFVYKSIKNIKCPYFNEEILFNSRGLEHLKFKSKYKVRERKDAYIRLKNIHLAPKILTSSCTLQEKQTKKIFIEIKTNSRHEKVLKKFDYYGFISIVKDFNYEKRLKVVVRQVDGGQKHFWSIIPYWKSNKELKMYSGNLEED